MITVSRDCNSHLLRSLNKRSPLQKKRSCLLARPQENMPAHYSPPDGSPYLSPLTTFRPSLNLYCLSVAPNLCNSPKRVIEDADLLYHNLLSINGDFHLCHPLLTNTECPPRSSYIPGGFYNVICGPAGSDPGELPPKHPCLQVTCWNGRRRLMVGDQSKLRGGIKKEGALQLQIAEEGWISYSRCPIVFPVEFLPLSASCMQLR